LILISEHPHRHNLFCRVENWQLSSQEIATSCRYFLNPYADVSKYVIRT